MSLQRVIKQLVHIPATIITLSACATTIRVNSTPQGAKVVAWQRGGAATELGTTPLNISQAQAANPLELRKEGYSSSFVAVPIDPGYAVDLNIELKKVDLASEMAQMLLTDGAPVLDRTLLDFFELQQALRRRDQREFEAVRERLLPKYQSVSMFHVLVGHFFLLREQVEQARAAYRTALKLNPLNTEAQNALERLGTIGGSQ